MVGNASSTPSDEVHALVRVWVSDRPGALGLVASRIGAVRGDIVAIDVLERGATVAIDEFAVNLPHRDVVGVLVREIEQVDGASVEQVRVVDHDPEARIDALESAALLCEADSASRLHEVLVTHVLGEFLAEWVALARRDTVLATAGHLPDERLVTALGAGTRASEALTGGQTGPDDLAVAQLPAHDTVLLVGRPGPPFRGRERAQLLALARITDRMWTLVG